MTAEPLIRHAPGSQAFADELAGMDERLREEHEEAIAVADPWIPPGRMCACGHIRFWHDEPEDGGCRCSYPLACDCQAFHEPTPPAPRILRDPRLLPGGETIEREIPGVGLLVFENYPPGTWLTQKGDPAKKARRRYLLDGEVLDDVSSIVGTLDSFALRTWIEKQATIGAVLAEREGELVDVPQEDWLPRVKSLGLGASAKAQEGADRGTTIHAAFEQLAREGTPPNPAEFPALARPWLQGAVGAWLALGIDLADVLLAVEEMVCHPLHRYAGRPDLVANVDGKVTLLDWKTSAKGGVWDKAHYQTRLYQMALAAMFVPVERVAIVAINDSGGFHIVECEASEEDALALLHTFRARRRIDSGMRAQRSIAKAAA